jgi:hypothetical protein
MQGPHKSPFMREFKMKMPQTQSAAQTLREPAQPKRAWTCHKSHFMRRPHPRSKPHVLCKPSQSKGSWTSPKGQFTRELPGTMPRPTIAAQTGSEPALSKCTWTCHKSRFMREFTGKMPQTRPWGVCWCHVFEVLVWNLLQVLARSSCRDPVETLLKRSLH